MLGLLVIRNCFAGEDLFRRGGVREAIQMKPRSERFDDRVTEDDIAQASLGGPRGAAELKPAKMTRQRKIKMPTERDYDPGHTA
jgi:hypothetical protein